VYKKGATLERHRDREACEISLTLHLSSNSEWPIYIQRPDGEEVSVDLSPGDVMMYRGNIADHWRERFEGTEYVQVFLHYVRSRGPNNWAFFDKTRTKPEVPVILMNEVTPEKKPEVKLTEPTKKYSKSLEDYIQVFEDIVPDSLCADILKEYGADADWSPTHVGQGVIDTGIRNVDSIAISRADVIGDSLERQRIDHELFKCAGEAIRRYNQVFPEAQIEQDSGYELLRYKTGQFYVQHTDSFKAQPRAVSCSFALNDNFSGGEWGFWDKDKIIKAKKGSAVMFPSNFMYPHEILPTTSGTRYSIITWFI
jgi:predicted 2-oxoglutarate/Fe(II)-dependent dioxygenase YbiX